MPSIFVFIYFWIIFLKFQLSLSSLHAKVGNYSQLNPKDCGITRLTENLDFGCFRWQKEFFDRLRDGRYVTNGEVPWMVWISIKGEGWWIFKKGGSACTGSMIADTWVLTAAHCIPKLEADFYEIYVGYEPIKDETMKASHLVRATEIHKHPDYMQTYLEFGRDDLALIKLEKSIKEINVMTTDGSHLMLRSICLPEVNILTQNVEPIMYSGWGPRSVVFYDKKLRMGYQLIAGLDDYSAELSHKVMITRGIPNKTRTCRGDSGGGAWQYDHKRAVILGVLASVHTFDDNGLCTPPGDEWIYSPRVSLYISWIKNVTKLN